MDHAERRIAIFHRVGDYAHGQKIEDLVERALLLLNLQMKGVKPLDARLHFGGDAAFNDLVADRLLNFMKELVEDLLLGAQFLGQLEIRIRLEIAEGQILELAADQAHAEAVGHGRVNVERFTGDALLALRVEKLERAHVVKTVGKLDHDDADIIDHCKQHLANVFRLARFRSKQVEAADLRRAFDEQGDIGAEHLRDLFEGDLRVLDDIVQQSGDESRHIELHVREQVRDFYRMRQERLAGKTCLGLVLLGGKVISAAEELHVVAGTVLADFVHKLDKAQVHCAAGGLGYRGFSGWIHGVL